MSPGVVLSQEISCGVTIGYADSSISDTDADIKTRTFDGRIELGFDSGCPLARATTASMHRSMASRSTSPAT